MRRKAPYGVAADFISRQAAATALLLVAGACGQPSNAADPPGAIALPTGAAAVEIAGDAGSSARAIAVVEDAVAGTANVHVYERAGSAWRLAGVLGGRTRLGDRVRYALERAGRDGAILSERSASPSGEGSAVDERWTWVRAGRTGQVARIDALGEVRVVWETGLDEGNLFEVAPRPNGESVALRLAWRAPGGPLLHAILPLRAGSPPIDVDAFAASLERDVGQARAELEAGRPGPAMRRVRAYFDLAALATEEPGQWARLRIRGLTGPLLAPRAAITFEAAALWVNAALAAAEPVLAMRAAERATRQLAPGRAVAVVAPLHRTAEVGARAERLVAPPAPMGEAPRSPDGRYRVEGLAGRCGQLLAIVCGGVECLRPNRVGAHARLVTLRDGAALDLFGGQREPGCGPETPLLVPAQPEPGHPVAVLGWLDDGTLVATDGERVAVAHVDGRPTAMAGAAEFASRAESRAILEHGPLSPDGRRFVFTDDTGLWLREGDRTRRVVLSGAPTTGRWRDLAWLPDGSAFLARRGADVYRIAPR